MKIEDILDILDNLADDEREFVLRPLLKVFSRVSLIALKELQNHCKTNNISYDEFVQRQNKLIRQCVELEMDDLGKLLRGESELADITLETDVAAIQ